MGHSLNCKSKITALTIYAIIYKDSAFTNEVKYYGSHSSKTNR
jgi:hypothetical protein